MAFKVVVALCVLMAVVAAVPAAPGPAGGWGPPGAGAWGPPGAGAWGPPGAAGGVNPYIPPWILAATWMPQWTQCTKVGKTCVDCNTKLVCTQFFGLQKVCTDPTKPHCNLGECSATPSAECAPATPVAPAAA